MKVFVSSVVKGFETYRNAIKSAVSFLDMTPVMSEDFESRSYSSEDTCFLEVEQSDVFVLILGKRYGHITSSGRSVTHDEFLHAKKYHKPILVFSQEIEKEDKQADFLKEVEDYESGYCRSVFSKPLDLKDQVLNALKTLRLEINSSPPEEFVSLAKTRLSESRIDLGRETASFFMSFLPIPSVHHELVSEKAQLDQLFLQICNNRLANLQEGYEAIKDKTYTAIKTPCLGVSYYEDGMISAIYNLDASPQRSHMGLVSPKLLRLLANGMRGLVDAKSMSILLRMDGMRCRTIKEPLSEKDSSVSINYTDSFAEYYDNLTPANSSLYGTFVNSALNKMERYFGEQL